MTNPYNDVGEVRFLSIRECADEIHVNFQTLKNWLIKNRHGVREFLDPVRVGRKAQWLIIPIGNWDLFVLTEWPAIRKAMEQRGWKPK